MRSSFVTIPILSLTMGSIVLARPTGDQALPAPTLIEAQAPGTETTHQQTQTLPPAPVLIEEPAPVNLKFPSKSA